MAMKSIEGSKPDKPTLGGELVEARILLSATWIDATADCEALTSTDGDDYLDALEGYDASSGAAGDGTLDGSADTDPSDDEDAELRGSMSNTSSLAPLDGSVPPAGVAEIPSATTPRTTEPISLGSLVSVSSQAPATDTRDAFVASDATNVVDPGEPTEGDEHTIDGILRDNLLEDSTTSPLPLQLPLVTADLVVANGGDSVELVAPVATLQASEAVTEVRWTQVSGTRIEIADDRSDVLLVSMPEVFLTEELVFAVEITRGEQSFRQEVTIQVQPIGMSSRSLAPDEPFDNQQVGRESEGDQGGRGLGKLWGALLAFFGTRSGRRSPE